MSADNAILVVHASDGWFVEHVLSPHDIDSSDIEVLRYIVGRSPRFGSREEAYEEVERSLEDYLIVEHGVIEIDARNSRMRPVTVRQLMMSLSAGISVGLAIHLLLASELIGTPAVVSLLVGMTSGALTTHQMITQGIVAR